MRVDEQLRTFPRQSLHHGWRIVLTVLGHQPRRNGFGVLRDTADIGQPDTKATFVNGKTGAGVDAPASLPAGVPGRWLRW